MTNRALGAVLALLLLSPVLAAATCTPPITPPPDTDAGPPPEPSGDAGPGPTETCTQKDDCDSAACVLRELGCTDKKGRPIWEEYSAMCKAGRENCDLTGSFCLYFGQHCIRRIVSCNQADWAMRVLPDAPCPFGGAQ